jgi:hypothetical protein
VLLCYDAEPETVYLADDAGNVAKLELGELKQWAICRHCGAKGFLDADGSAFVNAVTCAKCSDKE